MALLNAARRGADVLKASFLLGKCGYEGGYGGYHAIVCLIGARYALRLRFRSFKWPLFLFCFIRNGGTDKYGNTHNWSSA